MLDFNLEYYRAFYYVSQFASITKAAEALFLSQPAVTRSIRMLEERLGCRLFNRSSKGMKLTREGEVLFQHVNAAFTQLMNGERELAHMADYKAGTLNIAATETALYHYLLPRIEDFRNQYPKVFINLSGSSTQETIQMVRAGKADLALAVSPVAEIDDLTVVKATSFHDVFVTGTFFQTQLEGRTLSAREIAAFPIVTVEKGTSARRHIDLWFEEQGVLFEPDYSVRTTSAVLPFVERNLAIGILPELFSNEPLAEGKIHLVRTEKTIPARQVILLHKRKEELSILCRHFIEFLNLGAVVC